MPLLDEHLDKASHNEQFYGQFDIDTTAFLDWVVTGLFYCALHYIDAYLATKDIHPKKHAGPNSRNDSVEHMPEFHSIWPQYRALYDDSRDARYGFHPFGMRQFSAYEVVQLRDSDLATLRTHILQLPGMTFDKELGENNGSEHREV